jgi:hypothetical protein
LDPSIPSELREKLQPFLNSTRPFRFLDYHASSSKQFKAMSKLTGGFYDYGGYDIRILNFSTGPDNVISADFIITAYESEARGTLCLFHAAESTEFICITKNPSLKIHCSGSWLKRFEIETELYKKARRLSALPFLQKLQKCSLTSIGKERLLVVRDVDKLDAQANLDILNAIQS